MKKLYFFCGLKLTLYQYIFYSCDIKYDRWKLNSKIDKKKKTFFNVTKRTKRKA